MHSNCRPLPEDIVCKITQRNNIRRANTCGPALKLLNEEITSDMQNTKQNIWKEDLDAHWITGTTHTFFADHAWCIQQSTSTHTKHFHNIQQQIATTPKHIANCFTKQFTYTKQQMLLLFAFQYMFISIWVSRLVCSIGLTVSV